MRRSVVVVSGVLFFLALAASATAAPPLKLIGKDKMPASITGPKFDHLTVDVPGNRLFIAAQSAHQVLVFNLQTGKMIHAITGIKIPHAVFATDKPNRIFVTDGGAGGVRVYDGNTYEQLKFIQLKLDSDSYGYDPKTHDLYVVNGGGDANESFSMLSVINTDTESKVADIKLDGDTLEQMVIVPDSPLLYETDRALSRIDIINRDSRTLIGTWPVTLCKTAVSIALDQSAHRLFAACRSGAISVLDTKTGKEVKSLPIHPDVDELVFDAAHKRLYAATAPGYIDVYKMDGPDSYKSLGSIHPGLGSKNAVLAPSLDRLYTGVLPQSGDPGAIYVYQVQ